MNQTGLKCNCVLLALYGATEASLSWCPLHLLSFLWGEVIVPETRTQGRWAGRMKEGAPHMDKIQGSFLPVTFLLQPQIDSPRDRWRFVGFHVCLTANLEH